MNQVKGWVDLLKEQQIGLVSVTDTGDIPIEVRQIPGAPALWYEATVPAGHFGIDFGIVTEKCAYAIYIDGKNVCVAAAERTGRLYIDNAHGYLSQRDMHQLTIVNPSKESPDGTGPVRQVLRVWMDESDVACGTKLIALPGTMSKIDIFVFRCVDEAVELSQNMRGVGHGESTGQTFTKAKLGPTNFMGRIEIDLKIV
jgi:hypothetical protein